MTDSGDDVMFPTERDAATSRDTTRGESVALTA
jgi:hypothetical protein